MDEEEATSTDNESEQGKGIPNEDDTSPHDIDTLYQNNYQTKEVDADLLKQNDVQSIEDQLLHVTTGAANGTTVARIMLSVAVTDTVFAIATLVCGAGPQFCSGVFFSFLSNKLLRSTFPPCKIYT